jgi:hypothetical protein
VALIKVVREPVKQSRSSSECLHCGKSLGMRRFTGARFCCDAHAEADRRELQARMIARLRDSRAAFRTALDGHNTLRHLPVTACVSSNTREMSRTEVRPNDSVVGSALGLPRLQVYAYLTAGSSERSGS